MAGRPPKEKPNPEARAWGPANGGQPRPNLVQPPVRKTTPWGPPNGGNPLPEPFEWVHTAPRIGKNVKKLFRDPLRESGHCELWDRILAYILSGENITSAAHLLRLHPDTVRYWLEWGERDYHRGMLEDDTEMTEYAEFWLDVSYNQARFLQQRKEFFLSLEKKDKPMWLPSMIWLERNFPEQYGKKQQIKVEQSGTIQYKVEVVGGIEWNLGRSSAVAALPAGDEPDTLDTTWSVAVEPTDAPTSD